jgi:hypothetical protein
MQTQQSSSKAVPIETEALTKKDKGPANFTPTIPPLESVPEQSVGIAMGSQNGDIIALDDSNPLKNQHKMTSDSPKSLQATSEEEEHNLGDVKNQVEKQIQEDNHYHTDNSRLLMIPQLWLWKIDHRMYLDSCCSSFR